MTLTTPEFSNSSTSLYVSVTAGADTVVSFTVPPEQQQALSDEDLDSGIKALCDAIHELFPGQQVQWSKGWQSNATSSTAGTAWDEGA